MCIYIYIIITFYINIYIYKVMNRGDKTNRKNSYKSFIF